MQNGDVMVTGEGAHFLVITPSIVLHCICIFDTSAMLVYAKEHDQLILKRECTESISHRPLSIRGREMLPGWRSGNPHVYQCQVIVATRHLSNATRSCRNFRLATSECLFTPPLNAQLASFHLLFPPSSLTGTAYSCSSSMPPGCK